MKHPLPEDERTPLFMLAAALLLLLPLLLRVLAGNPVLPGVESYIHLAGGPSLYDATVGRIGDFALFISVLLGLCTVWLYSAVLQRKRIIGLALLLINPLFVSLFTSLSPLTIAVPASILAFLAARREQFVLLPLFVGITAAFSPLLALIVLLVLAIRLHRTKVLLLCAAVGLGAALLAGPPVLEFTRFTDIISEFGAHLGLSLLYVSLAILEGIARWGERRGRVEFALFLALLPLSLYSLDLRVAAGLISTVFAAGFIERLLVRRFRLREAREFTLLLIACLLLFLLLARAGTLLHEEPTNGLVGTLAALPPDGSLVLAPASVAPLVTVLSQHPVENCDACDDIVRLYATRNLDEAQKILDSRSIRYLLITREMREGGVWNRDEEGLLFLLQHSDRFTRVAGDADEDLWRYDREPSQKR